MELVFYCAKNSFNVSIDLIISKFCIFLWVAVVILLLSPIKVGQRWKGSAVTMCGYQKKSSQHKRHSQRVEICLTMSLPDFLKAVSQLKDKIMFFKQDLYHFCTKFEIFLHFNVHKQILLNF